VTRLDTFDTLVGEQEADLDRVGTLLRSAAAAVEDMTGNGGYAGAALRARGAAIHAATAAHELYLIAGSLQLAAAVSDSGLLDEENGQ
jgi:hypothetical protein